MFEMLNESGSGRAMIIKVGDYRDGFKPLVMAAVQNIAQVHQPSSSVCVNCSSCLFFVMKFILDVPIAKSVHVSGSSGGKNAELPFQF